MAYFAQYLAELTLLDAETYQAFTPSIIGAASVALARHTYDLPAWDTDLMEKSGGMRISDFKLCIARLYETLVKAPKYPQQAVREKYRNEKYVFWTNSDSLAFLPWVVIVIRTSLFTELISQTFSSS